MNMKKTMAAIAAGAVAVSAMATSVSALADKTLPYNLAEAIKETSSGTVVLTSTFSDVALTEGDNLAFGIQNLANAGFEIQDLTIRVIYPNSASDNRNYTFSNDWSADNYNWNVGGGSMSLDVGANKPIAESKSGEKASITISATVKHNLPQYSATGDVFQKCQNNGVNTFINVNYAGAKTLDVSASGYKDSTTTYLKAPMETNISGNYNIISYLQGKNVNGDDKTYMNVGAVINDAIANYEGVVFKFNTAKEYVRFGIMVDGNRAHDEASLAAAEKYIADKISEATGKLESAKATSAIKDAAYATDPTGMDIVDTWKTTLQAKTDAAAAVKAAEAELKSYQNATIQHYYTPNSWEGEDYTKFNQHLYNGNNNLVSLKGNFAGEGTGYTGFDWGGYNLFQGGLVINEALTMSLSDTEFFDWQETSISFDWDSIYSNAMTSNNFATYVQSLKLATSTRWYWDSMEVELTAGAAEDASSGAGATGDDETLDDGDDDAGDDISLDDDGDDDDGDIAGDDDDDGDDIDTDTNDTQAPTQTASNPQTGNASVALAVIPVALAAAAIVAKKRG